MINTNIRHGITELGFLFFPFSSCTELCFLLFSFFLWAWLPSFSSFLLNWAWLPSFSSSLFLSISLLLDLFSYLCSFLPSVFFFFSDYISFILLHFRRLLSFSPFLFIDAFSHLYKRVCPSIRPSVCPSIGPSHTSWFSEKWAEIRRFKDKYAGSSPENASVVRILFDLFSHLFTGFLFFLHIHCISYSSVTSFFIFLSFLTLPFPSFFVLIKSNHEPVNMKTGKSPSQLSNILARYRKGENLVKPR